MPTLGVSVTTNYRTAPNNALVNGQDITTIQFSNASASATASFDSTQFGGTSISNTVLLRGNANTNLIDVSLSAAGSFSAAGWTFSAWTDLDDQISLSGSSGNDSITGSSQSDVLFGRGGNDTLIGGGGRDTIDGGTGADSMTGGGGGDTYYVDNLGDVIIEVADTIAGGVDSVFASVSFTQWTGVEYMTVTGGNALTGTGNDDFGSMSATTRTAAVTFLGLGGNDYLTGSDFADSLDGGADNDSIVGGAGNDTLIGGLGLDTMTGGDGNDEMHGGDGADTFVFNAATEIGSDIIDGAGSFNTLAIKYAGIADFRTATIASTGQTSIDLLTMTSDSIFSGIVTFNASQVNATGVSAGLGITGDVGTDIVRFENASGVFNLSALGFTNWTSDDQIEIKASASANITGTSQRDIFTGSAAADTLDGGDEADEVFGGGGADRLIGGNAGDLFSFAAATDIAGDTVDGGSAFGAPSGDVLAVYFLGTADFSGVTFQSAGSTSIETLALIGPGAPGNNAIDVIFNASQFGATGLFAGLGIVSNSFNPVADSITINNVSGTFSAGAFTFGNWNAAVDRLRINGTGTADMIIGSSQHDSLTGGLGNDILDGGSSGNDSFDGGGGVDTLSYFYATSGAGILFYMLAPNLNGGDAAGDIYSQFENVTGTTVNDRIYMDNADNSVMGSGGFDTVELYAGNDSYLGGSGFDYVLGGAGNDVINVTDGGSLIYGEADDDSITGYSGSNEFNGGLGNDTLIGGDGQDVILGGAGLDSISAGLGNDFLFGEDGNDIVIGGDGNDQIQGGIGLDSLFGGVGVDVLQGGADGDELNGDSDVDFLFGEAGNDTLFGGTGNDQVFGGTENDSLVGNAGVDILNGGDGNDTLNDQGTGELTFSIGGNGNDTIIGTSGQDQMWGGTGAIDSGRDVFQFGANNGFDIIFDFQAGAGVVDQISLIGTGIASFAQLQAENRIGQAGANTQINLPGAGNVIFLINTTASSLVADDFLFA